MDKLDGNLYFGGQGQGHRRDKVLHRLSQLYGIALRISLAFDHEPCHWGSLWTRVPLAYHPRRLQVSFRSFFFLFLSYEKYIRLNFLTSTLGKLTYILS